MRVGYALENDQRNRVYLVVFKTMFRSSTWDDSFLIFLALIAETLRGRGCVCPSVAVRRPDRDCFKGFGARKRLYYCIITLPLDENRASCGVGDIRGQGTFDPWTLLRRLCPMANSNYGPVNLRRGGAPRLPLDTRYGAQRCKATKRTRNHQPRQTWTRPATWSTMRLWPP